MSDAIKSKGVSLASIFDPYVAGTTKARASGINDAGVDLSSIYANIIYGSAAAITGIGSQSADINTLYAAKGTASYSTPDNGDVYQSNYLIPNSSSGSAGVQMYISSLAPLQYTVAKAGTVTTAYASYAVPDGMLYFKATLTYVSGTAAVTIVQTTDWTRMTALNQAMAEMVSSVEEHAFGTMTGNYSCFLQFSANGLKTIYAGTTMWNYKLDGSV